MTPAEGNQRQLDFSVFLPFLAHRPEQFVPYMALVQRSTAQRLWTGQPLLLDACQGFAFAAGMGLRAPVGLAVALAPTRHPFEAALQARGLALTTGHSVVMGFGPGSPEFQQGLLGQAYASPLTAMREFICMSRALLDGELVQTSGDYFTLRGRQGRVSHPPVHWGLGVLRRGMASLAGEVADVAITWLTPPAYIGAELVPRMRQAAARVGRPAPRVVAAVHVALAQPGRDPIELIGRTNQGHLRAPHYRDMLRRAGVPTDDDDWRIGARGLLDSGVFVFEDEAGLSQRLAAYRDAGVDEVALHLHGAADGQRTADTIAEIQTVLTAVTATAVGSSRVA